MSCIGECRQAGFCSVDCDLAPWSFDKPYLTGPCARFKMLLRFRRWAGTYLSSRMITWVRPERHWRWR